MQKLARHFCRAESCFPAESSGLWRLRMRLENLCMKLKLPTMKMVADAEQAEKELGNTLSTAFNAK